MASSTVVKKTSKAARKKSAVKAARKPAKAVATKTRVPSATKKPGASKTDLKKTPGKKTPGKKAPGKKAPSEKTPGKAARGAQTAARPAGAKPTTSVVSKGAKNGSMKKFAARADYGAPAEGFFAKQPPALREIAEKLRELIEEAAPEATASLKWGMPCYAVNGEMMCLLGGHKSHLNLVLPGSPGTYADPEGLLEGDGKTGRRLKITSMSELPIDTVRRWLATAAERVRAS